MVDAGDRRDARDPAAGADDDLAVDALAQDPVGRADVVLALGRDRRRLDAEARRAHRRGGLVDDLVAGLAALLEREVVAVELEREPDDVGVEHAEGLLEQLLPGLVALEDGDRQRFGGHAGKVASRAEPPARAVLSAPAMPEHCSWCGAAVAADDGFRVAEPEGERKAVFCRLEHVVPWVIRGAHWEPGRIVAARRARRRARPLRAVRRRARRPSACCVVRHRGEHRIARRVLPPGAPARLGQGRRPLQDRLVARLGRPAASAGARAASTALSAAPPALTRNAACQPAASTIAPADHVADREPDDQRR